MFDEASLRYVAAALLSLLGDLHESQVLFRGLQPELLYLDALGRIIATDFHFAKLGLEKVRREGGREGGREGRWVYCLY